MKFEKVRAGEYRARLKNGVYIYVIREGRHWVWFLSGYDNTYWVAWETDNNGPFPTRREAIADAVDNYGYLRPRISSSLLVEIPVGAKPGKRERQQQEAD